MFVDLFKLFTLGQLTTPYQLSLLLATGIACIAVLRLFWKCRGYMRTLKGVKRCWEMIWRERRQHYKELVVIVALPTHYYLYDGLADVFAAIPGGPFAFYSAVIVVFWAVIYYFAGNLIPSKFKLPWLEVEPVFLEDTASTLKEWKTYKALAKRSVNLRAHIAEKVAVGQSLKSVLEGVLNTFLHDVDVVGTVRIKHLNGTPLTQSELSECSDDGFFIHSVADKTVGYMKARIGHETFLVSLTADYGILESESVIDAFCAIIACGQ